MAQVKCLYCGQSFDRLKEPFAKKSNRYIHKDCALKKDPNAEIIDPTNNILCFYCKKMIPKDNISRYISEKVCVCDKCKDREPTDEEKLNEYLMKLFNLDYIDQALKKRAETFVTKNGYTYSGMLGTLKYFYEVLRNPIPAKPTIGIIPYIYWEAKKYYIEIYQARANNKKSIIENKEFVVEISKPKIKKKSFKYNFFEFLEGDNI